MKLPILSSREVCKFLEKQGFVAIRQKGSHRFYRHLDGRTTTVPIHSNKDISRGLLKGILDEIGMNRERFFNTCQMLAPNHPHHSLAIFPPHHINPLVNTMSLTFVDLNKFKPPMIF